MVSRASVRPRARHENWPRVPQYLTAHEAPPQADAREAGPSNHPRVRMVQDMEDGEDSSLEVEVGDDDNLEDLLEEDDEREEIMASPPPRRRQTGKRSPFKSSAHLSKVAETKEMFGVSSSEEDSNTDSSSGSNTSSSSTESGSEDSEESDDERTKRWKKKEK